MDLIEVSETCAESKLQDLVDHDAKRLIHLIETTDDSSVLDGIEDGDCLEFHHKWGTDGSGDHSRYSQSFSENTAADDSTVLLTAMSALQLRVVGRDGLPPKILWDNPTPSLCDFASQFAFNFRKRQRSP